VRDEDCFRLFPLGIAGVDHPCRGRLRQQWFEFEGPLVPGAGLVARNTRMQSSTCLLNLSTSKQARMAVNDVAFLLFLRALFP
jgi:hypothetical protein